MIADNPFPAKAVSTFGVTSASTGSAVIFAPMLTVREIMIDYMKAHPRKGASVALSGAHGAGKTFCLRWLIREAETISVSQPKIIYAKADTPGFAELYRQIWISLTRAELDGVLQRALRRDAATIIGEAKTTETISGPMEASGALEAAYKSGVLDVNALNVRLRKALEEASLSRDVARKVAAALGLLSEPLFGETAFEWLSGRGAVLPNEALKLPLLGETGQDPGEIAVAALEVLAELYRLAETPLIVLVDQTENLLTPSLASSSLLKKLIEQLESRSALLVMAGTPLSWSRLPRDVSPRLEGRAPIAIGNLSEAEIHALVAAYGGAPSASTVQHLRELSGGNPREILQICHQLVETHGEDAWTAPERALVMAARNAGTLNDRGRQASEILAQLCEELELTALPPNWPDAGAWDRRIQGRDQRFVAVVVQMATDAVAETELARRVTRLRRDLSVAEGCVSVLLISIGYGSERVRTLLADHVGVVIPFEEATFAAQIRPRLVTLRDVAPPPAAPNDLSQAVQQRLDQLESQISAVAVERAAAERQRAERLEANFKVTSAPERSSSEARTRQELRDGLDSLGDARIENDLPLERGIIRSLLIANQANVRDEAFDLLGGYYLEAVELALSTRNALLYDDTTDETATDTAWRLYHYRSDLLQQLRRRLSPSGSRIESRLPFQIAAALFVAAIVAALTFYLCRDLGLRAETTSQAKEIANNTPIWTIVGTVLSGAATFGTLYTTQLSQFQYRRFGLEIASLRRRALRAPASAPPFA